MCYIVFSFESSIICYYIYITIKCQYIINRALCYAISHSIII